MFTGIVEEIGKIRKIKENNLVIECKKVIKGSNIGDSISVSGICLTITSITDDSLHLLSWQNILPFEFHQKMDFLIQ